MNSKIKIIVAESREVFRKSLVALLHTYPEFKITADSATGRELLETLKQKEADIVLLDEHIGGMDCKVILDVIQQRFPAVRVIILSDKINAEVQTDYMAHGANSFLGKSCDVKTLLTAIHKVKLDGYFFDSVASKALLEAVLKDKQRLPLPFRAKLTERETDILKRICDGNTNKEIAVNLNLSASTIDFYRTKIYNKTGCSNVTGLVKFALRHGIVSLS